MRVRVLMATILLGATLAFAGCGGDNIDLCDGCNSPTATPIATPTPLPSATSTPGGA